MFIISLYTMEKYFLGICRSIWDDPDKTYIEDKETDTEVAVKKIDDTMVVVFKPTNSEKDHYYNFDFRFVDATWMPQGSGAMVHCGFMTKLKAVAEAIDHALLPSEDNQFSQVVFTGFSQGGAMAQITAHRYKTIFSSKNIDVVCYAFGSPRVGNKCFVQNYNQIIEKSCRVYYGYDPVPSLPPRFFFYKDTKNPLWVKRDGKGISKVERPWWKSLMIIVKWKFNKDNFWESDHGSQILFESL